MNSRASREFWKQYRQLPKVAQQRARKAFRLFEQDARHPGLEFKKLLHGRNYYSARVSDDYRAVGLMDDRC